MLNRNFSCVVAVASCTLSVCEVRLASGVVNGMGLLVLAFDSTADLSSLSCVLLSTSLVHDVCLRVLALL